MERGQDAGAGIVGVELDIIADGVGGEEAVNPARGEQVPADDVVEQFLRVVEEFAGLWFLQDGRVASAQFPGVEEGGPVNEGDEGGEGDGVVWDGCVMRDWR